MGLELDDERFAMGIERRKGRREGRKSFFVGIIFVGLIYFIETFLWLLFLWLLVLMVMCLRDYPCRGEGRGILGVDVVVLVLVFEGLPFPGRRKKKPWC